MGFDHDVRSGGDAGGAEQYLGHLLVHARGTGQHAAAHIANAQHLEHSLNGAILPVGAVKQGKDDVHAAQDVRSGGRQGGQRSAAELDRELTAPQAVGGDLHRRAGVVQSQGGRIVVDEYPLTAQRDADGQDLIAVAVDGR